MGKYDPLTAFLRRQVSDEVQLTFEDFADEDRIGIELPPSAKTYEQWWENQESPGARQCRSWLDAGWEVKKANLTAEFVVFRRRA
jgi:hypothetical protein